MVRSLTGVKNSPSPPSQPLRVEEVQNFDCDSSSALIILKELKVFEYGVFIHPGGVVQAQGSTFDLRVWAAAFRTGLRAPEVSSPQSGELTPLARWCDALWCQSPSGPAEGSAAV